MWVKICKKVLLVLAVVMLLASAAMAAPSTSALTGGRLLDGDESLVRELEGGITVTINGTNRHTDDNDLIVYYIVVSEEDTMLKVEASGNNGALFDNGGRRFTEIDGGKWTLIGGTRTKEREIIGGVPTEVAVYYQVNDTYKVAERFPRVSIIINGKALTFRNFSSAR